MRPAEVTEEPVQIVRERRRHHEPAAEPLVSWTRGDFSVQLTGALRFSGESVQSFQADSTGALELSPSPLETRIRVTPAVRYGPVGAVGEVDLLTGAVSGLPSDEVLSELGAKIPHPKVENAVLRQVYLEYKGATWLARAGKQTSQWGLGMVANSGGGDPAPGEGFGDQHYGDLVWRGLVAGRPFFGMGGAWRAIEPALAVDLVDRDDTATYSAGDRAIQGILAVRFKVDDERNFGLYAVYRHQRALQGADITRATDAYVADLAFQWKWKTRRGAEMKLGTELAWISGWSTVARTPEHPRSDISQFGAAVKSSYKRGRVTWYLDLGWASGDQNPYDDKLEGFRFDPDYKVGLLLFPEVLGWQSARTAARASDPNVVGYAPDGVDSLPTRGSITGAAYLNPRVKGAVWDWLDVYAGPLFAWTTSQYLDAYETRVNGGDPVNTFGVRAGPYLGTELDAGAQARYSPVKGLDLALTGEVGWLLPGSALDQPDPADPTRTQIISMPAVLGGRLKLTATF